MDFRGIFTALVTPFRGDQLDEEGLAQNIRAQIKAGITGIVLLGTTGETPTLTEEEQEKIIRIGVREAKNKTLVIVGTASNSTQETIALTKKAKELGADAALIVAPYYNKPTQEGLFLHYEAIATQVDIPILVYNIQGRTGVNIETATLLRIAALPNIVGVKEASGNIGQIADVIQIVKGRYPSFSVLSGDDAVALPLIALGGDGLISVASNLMPERVVALIDAALDGRFDDSRKIHEDLLPFFRLQFVETNPIPIKEAMQLCGLPAGNCRLPLCGLQQKNREKLAELLKEMGLLLENKMSMR